MVRCGESGRGRQGEAGRGEARSGRHGKARLGCVGLGQFDTAKVPSNHEITYCLRCVVGGLLGITF